MGNNSGHFTPITLAMLWRGETFTRHSGIITVQRFFTKHFACILGVNKRKDKGDRFLFVAYQRDHVFFSRFLTFLTVIEKFVPTILTTLFYMHTYHSRFIPEGAAEVS
jgi:hypothetical protein